jgi:hypothetical protein
MTWVIVMFLTFSWYDLPRNLSKILPEDSDSVSLESGLGICIFRFKRHAK